MNWRSQLAGIRELDRIAPRQMRVGPDGRTISVRTLALHRAAGICPPGERGERMTTYSPDEYALYWERLARRGLPRRRRDVSSLNAGRFKAGKIQAQRSELFALVKRVPLGAAHLVADGVAGLLRRHGMELLAPEK